MIETGLNGDRRAFLSGVAIAAAGVGLAQISANGEAAEPAGATPTGGTDFQAWLGSIKGKHRQVYDMPEPNNGMGLIWSHIFLLTGAQGYGVPESDLTAVVVMRHNAIPIAMNDTQWAKYKLGEVFKINDPGTKAPALRNPFNNVKPGDLPLPEAALDKLVPRGVKFAVCDIALTLYSAMVAKQMGLEPAAVKKDWAGAVLPGVQLAPSGVVALNGAQAHGCSYVFAG
jgi:intracellular sulfur oxidation DsrE/DsrF family protein